MLIHCPRCQTRLQIQPAHLGKQLRCSKCGQRFQAGSTADGGAVQPQAPTERQSARLIRDQRGVANPQPAAPRPPDSSAEIQETFWREHARLPNTETTEEPFAPWDRTETDATETSGPDAPEPLPHRSPVGAGRADSQASQRQTSSRVVIGLGSVADFAFDQTKITWAILWGLLWAGSVAVTGVLASSGLVILLPILLPVVTWVCYLGLVSGISHLTAVKQQTGHSGDLATAWELVLRRSVSLVFGTLGVTILFLLSVGFLYGGIFTVSHVPMVGQILGGILLIPSFLLILVSITLALNLYLLPVIIGVEDCTALHAFGILRQLATRNAFALVASYFSAFLKIIPFAVVTGVITAGGLAGAMVLCGGENVLQLLRGGIPIGSVLQVGSVLVILASWLAFVAVFATVSLALVYCDSVSHRE